MIRLRIVHLARRYGAFGFILMAALALGAQDAAAHSQLTVTNPRPGEIVRTAPEDITLKFNEPVSISPGAVKVYDDRGRRVDAGRVETAGDGSVVRALIKGGTPEGSELPNGTYIVVWKVASADGHPISGAFTFSVREPSLSPDAGRDVAAKYLAQTGASVPVGVLSALGRGIGFAGLTLMLGALGASLFWAYARRDAPALNHIVIIGFAAALGGGLLALLVQGAYAAGLGLGDVFDLSLLGDVLGTRFGRALLLRIVLLVGVFAWWQWSRRTDRRTLARVTGIVLALSVATSVAMGGHAATGPLPVLGVVVDVLHLVPIAVWFGGLAVLAYVALRDDPPPWPSIDVFSKVSLWAVLLIVVSGGVQSWRQLGSVDALTETAYGQVLIAKVVVFLLVIPLAAFGRDLLRRRVEPAERKAAQSDPELAEELEGGVDVAVVQRKLRRSVLVELGFLVVVFALTAVLVNLVPGREAIERVTSVQTRNDQATLSGTIAPGRVGPNDIHLTVFTPEGLPADVNTMTARLERDDVGALELPLRRLGTGHYFSPAFVIPRQGTWKLVVTTDLDAFTRTTLSQDVEIR